MCSDTGFFFNRMGSNASFFFNGHPDAFTLFERHLAERFIEHDSHKCIQLLYPSQLISRVYESIMGIIYRVCAEWNSGNPFPFSQPPFFYLINNVRPLTKPFPVPVRKIPY